MKNYIILICLLPVSSAFAQEPALNRQRIFMELATGYSWNYSKPLAAELYGKNSSYVEEEILGERYFIHGVMNSFNIGAPVCKYFGFAGKYSLSLHFPMQGKMAEYYQEKYPDLSITVKAPAWRISNLQIGGYFTVPYKQWNFDVQLLLGKATVSVPWLLITGTKELQGGNEYYLRILRDPQKHNINTISPSLGLRYHYSPKFHLSFRAEMLYSLNPEFITVHVSEFYHPAGSGPETYRLLSYNQYSFIAGLGYSFGR